MKVAYHNAVANVLTGEGVVADITVYEPGTTTKVDIFSDSGGTPLDNPLTTDTYGRFVFYVDPGTYDIKITGDEIDTHTLSDVSILALAKAPDGKYAVTNLYVDSTTGKLVVKYDDTAI